MPDDCIQQGQNSSRHKIFERYATLYSKPFRNQSSCSILRQATRQRASAQGKPGNIVPETLVIFNVSSHVSRFPTRRNIVTEAKFAFWNEKNVSQNLSLKNIFLPLAPIPLLETLFVCPLEKQCCLADWCPVKETITS